MTKQFGNKSVLGLALTATLAFSSVPATAQTNDGAQEASVYYVVRHAEKQCDKKGGDPALTTYGQTRANALAELLKDKNISYIYATKKQKTTQTAQPLAQIMSLSISQYQKKQACEFANKIKHVSGNHLVIAHAKDLPTIVSQLSNDRDDFCKVLPGMSKVDFDQMYVVTVPEDEDPVQSTYGAASNPCNK